ncbi:MAG: NTP transferase domain-containing protein [Patescibacteria group bacterium]|jgi:bifunctional UDP-N-acetylglucosamine pyrophosphorylase/glucosamine-1-phosphate N-acetyltransferase
MSIRVVILAAGKGKRMGPSELPKVLHEVLGKPMLGYVLDAVVASGVDEKPVVVVGHMAEKVKEVCEDRCEYAVQSELKGTGDAVMRAQPLLEGSVDDVIVLVGDQPFTSAASVRKLADMHLASGATLTIGTVTVSDYEEWRKPFADFGRIVRGENGAVERIVEVKDAAPDVLAIREVFPSFYCFKAAWLWESLKTLTTDNAQGEYYLTALLSKAITDGEQVTTVPIQPEEALGINTTEQLEIAERLMRERK